jgi:hypothetical protein
MILTPLANAQQIPFTEEFDDTTYRAAPPATTAEWGNGVLRLPLATSAAPIKTLTGPFTGAASAIVDAADDVSSRVVAAGDLDGDGDLDLVFGNAVSDAVYFNAGGGTFVRGSAIPDDFLSGNTRSIAIADLNGDGHLDVVFARFGSNQATRVHFNNGEGAPQIFTEGDYVDLGPASLNGDSLATGDVDNDGDIDVALGIRGGYVQLFLNDGFGNFDDPIAVTDSGLPSFGFHARSVALADLDRNGSLDLVAALELGAVRIYRNDGFGDFTAFPTQSGGGGIANKLSAPDSIAIGDVDGDGQLDIVVGNDGSDSDLTGDGNPDPGVPNRVYINSSIASGLFPVAVDIETDLANTDSVSLVDVDRDGDLDILTADLLDLTTGDTNKWYANDGTGGFPVTGTDISADANLSKSQAVADFNGDGKLDVAYANDPTGVAGGAVNRVVLNVGTDSLTDSDQLFATAQSVQVNGADSLSGGLILSSVDNNPITNSIFSYWLSDDNGLTWVAVEPDRSVAFPSVVGPALRFRIDMSSPSPNAFWRPEIDSITITRNRAPFFLSNEVTDGTQDQLYSYAIGAADPDGESVNIIASSPLPAWLTLTDNGDGTGTLEGTPTNDNVGAAGNDVSIRVLDAAGRNNTQTFTITVANVNDAPTVVAPTGDQTYSENDIVDLNTATAFEDIDGDVLTYAAAGLPVSLSLDTVTGVISGTLTNDDAINGPDYAVTITADDGNGGTVDDAFTLTVTNVNAPPEFTSVAVTAATEDVAYTYDIAVTDDDGDAIAITGAGLPGWLTLTDNGDGTASLAGTPAAANVGDVTVTITADDGTVQVDQQFTITVEAAAPPPPPPPPPRRSGGGSFGIPFLMLLLAASWAGRTRRTQI